MSKLKQIIANLPGIRHYLYARHRRRCAADVVDMVHMDAQRVLQYGGFRHLEQADALLSNIGMEYHKLEKGLTMPNFRPGFGQAAVRGLMGLVRQYAARFPMPAFEVHHALTVLAEYREVNAAYEGAVAPELQAELDALLAEFPAQPSRQPVLTTGEFWAARDAAFPQFSASRHCVRALAGPAPREDILAAVQLACNAPSACNRQYVRVHFYEKPAKVQEILALQNGNRGFGDTVRQLLIVTADFHGMRWQEERHDLYTNAGIFLMNLCYALHYHKVAHCLLNWSENAQKDAALHELADIPGQEAVACILSCGKAPDTIKLTSSPRKSAADILTIHHD